MQLPSEKLEMELDNFSESTIYDRNRKWFEETYIDGAKDEYEPYLGDKLEVGKIYTFRYSPKYADELSFYDNQPMSIIIGHVETKAGNVNALGINLSFIPPKVRPKILDKIVKVFNTMVIDHNIEMIQQQKFRSQKELPLYYDICKKILKDSGFEFAIRSYIYSRMETKPKILSYEDWWRLCTFPSKYIQKLNIRAIYYRYKKKLDSGYKLGQKDKPVNIERTKIKDLKAYLKKRNSNKS